MPDTLRSEEDFLALIDECFPTAHPDLAIPRGDDCALVRSPADLLISTDIFLENVHFRRSYFSAGDIGHKALAVNLSDMAAMGGRPLTFSLGLTTPPGLPRSFFAELFAAMAGLADQHGAFLSGGDLSRGDALSLCITILGTPAPGGQVLRRGQCRPGDLLLVLGRPGLARAGLLALEADPADAARDFPTAVAAHLRPRALVDEGLKLAALPGVRGAMDVSDGLARDLPRFLGPKLGACLALPPHFLHPEIEIFCRKTGVLPDKTGASPASPGVLPAETFALLGGEDYALLAAVDPDHAPAVLAALPRALPIGQVAAKPDLILHGQPLNLAGFDHFSNGN
ncbi:MAG: thiamine-phosphate kinase [Thermodesulfobacteriota bacterium]